MPTPAPPSPQTAHILYLDIVGFSRESIEGQGRLLERLNALVMDAEIYAAAREAGNVLEVPSGDGMALVFYGEPDTPALCAVEVDRAVRASSGDPSLALRMGIHSGQVQRIPDISRKENVVGEGIVLARRVMDFGDEGHILMSGQYAAWLGQSDAWKDCVVPIGEAIAKHEQKIHLFALYSSGDEGGCAAAGDVPFGRADLPVSLASGTGDATGGAVVPGSRFYIERACDSELRAALDAGESILLLKGPRQVGKTSLMAQGVQWARISNATGRLRRRIMMTDFQKIGAAQMASDETLYRLLAASFARQMAFSYDWANEWDPIFGANLNFEAFLRALIEAAPDEPLIWCLDEVDKLFVAPFASDFFGLIRSWHNARSTEPGGPWDRLTVVIAYATEAHLFIRDMNQSPFNVGRRLDLDDFTIGQTAALAARYGGAANLDRAGLEALYELIAGQPFLTRKALETLANGKRTLPDLLAEASRDGGGVVFGDHLKRILVSVSQLPAVASALGHILDGRIEMPAGGQARDACYRLIAAGIVRQTDDGHLVFRCELYRRYLRKNRAELAAQ